ncbi:hypothetical protein EMIHUDRAFT_224536 [Emiliania huxleyi CCMP1516]|uniref:Uncharacterized protein n=2 Tax=Emiliania huxleyi TaxID=2903 RepID=A0A0D3JQD3_EMIH1|nr:hypothetical protein EMIHUDRAFT_205805 [Emiliania huxleyi CCMP1516]XP_005790884.1 hypothetical protein EMIHUDRAFT_224536 [Emiliania huxleyi CCMP1516]EOD25718.1 hypothetical protein EMIHUDRAFT_205805 [Emiliania huxleyi CCMP1516]EOD38455.1 hypothetical protein EMIHUDRAFT_224536 [Emiliania huxleyi CCMP1516]|eukprot:XP_005778147.1 hypothetical protein EMIHUDRAFT_205805 [Emiliania huxleyi CCMP1516]
MPQGPQQPASRPERWLAMRTGCAVSSVPGAASVERVAGLPSVLLPVGGMYCCEAPLVGGARLLAVSARRAALCAKRTSHVLPPTAPHHCITCREESCVA